MKRTLPAIAVFSVMALVAFQTSNAVIRKFAGVPTGACSFLQLGMNGSNGDLYTCPAGTWVKVSGGGGSGTVTNTGTLTSGQLIKGNGGVDITVGDLSGDATTSGSTATTVVSTHLSSALPINQGGTGNSTTVAAHNYFGNNTGGAAAPAFVRPVCADLSDSASGCSTAALATPVSIANGGTGTGSTLTGLVRGSASAMTAAELSGDATTSGSNAVTVVKVNGASVPASASVLGSNSSSQLIADTSHNIVAPLLCVDSSGSATAQSCTTSPSFTPAAGDTLLYRTTTANTGALTLNVNSTSAQAVQFDTAALSGNEIIAGHYYLLVMNNAATGWDLSSVSNIVGEPQVTIYNSHSVNTFTKPSVCNTLTFILYGAGGSGAGGQVKTANATVTLGGTGGGGGAYSVRTMKCSDVVAPISITVGTGGASVAAATSGNPGTASTVTMNSVQILFAGGGGAGFTSNGTAAISGGSGGGSIGNGVIGSTATTSGGSPATVNGAVGISGQGAGGNTTSTNGTAEFGGGAGGGVPVGSGTSFHGGSSIYGAPGGGGGGAVSGTTVSQNGGDGGTFQSFSLGGGPAGGAKCSTSGCTAGNGNSGGSLGSSTNAGQGGAGGGACETTTASGTCTAGNGSNGKTPGAGGGGGGAANTNAGTGTAGTGGSGADGYAMVIVN